MESESLSDEEFLSLLRPLTLGQYDECKSATVTRIKKMIGEKPERKKMARDMGPLLNPLDWLAIVVFFAAFLISSVHILTHIGQLSKGIFFEQFDGILISRLAFSVIHQIGFLALSESSMLLFLVIYRLDLRKRNRLLFKLFNIYLILSLTAMVFIFSANLSAGLPILEAIMPAIFTIGISLNLESVVVEMLDRRASVNQKYQIAISTWEKATDDPTQYPNYKQLLIREIWEKLSKLKDNNELIDVSIRHKILAVSRELQRDEWAKEMVSSEHRVEIMVQRGINKNEAEKLIGKSPLLDLVKLIRENKDNIIKTEIAGANLIENTWIDFRNNKTYGPYKNKKLLILAILRRAQNDNA